MSVASPRADSLGAVRPPSVSSPQNIVDGSKCICIKFNRPRRNANNDVHLNSSPPHCGLGGHMEL